MDWMITQQSTEALSAYGAGFMSLCQEIIKKVQFSTNSHQLTRLDKKKTVSVYKHTISSD